MNKDVFTQLTRARTSLIIDQPFFGELAIRLKLVEREDIPTLAVDGKHIFYNPKFVETLSPALTIAAVGHETGHCVYDHISRRGGRNPRKWNMAGDYVINAMLKDAGFTIGDTWLFNSAYAGMSSDEIYNLLPEQDGPSEPGPLDEIMDGDPNEAETMATEWKIAVVQAAQSAKACGKLPASMQRFVDELVSPKVDWRDQLRRFITEVSKNDYSWARPNRRFIPQGFILPGLYSESMGLLVNGIDTSGSIDQATLTAFGSEIIAARNATDPDGLVNIYCDAHVAHVDTYSRGDEIAFELHGGGGTDFRPPFAYIEEFGLKPACFVYLTDGYGPFPETPPPYPVLWCMTTDVVPPWGEVVRIEI